ncbi:breast carcinoma-amplified sequence 3 homolog [Nasonia vitripennis]|uniref:BCAS3 WD40 domain-containing protein n=1 Tax=Nasonia vitripennis TaxID=7425 RepID=A0A7M7QA55_NASVI|nr:breast carcinoma-amplified sequence 3 homolog [Nasonia vitripennis]XP_031783259.1 breast carcinoma-amplified sequence 3 homolog [Nasonia vitripennis]XP_031783260.1 breast carcinoma-amplified sequence 3 homolog [Nasonia vitripennis]XP_032453916.1 breast carcinoma-amplified sequence 3 homolog [Nasonia vitripennis]
MSADSPRRAGGHKNAQVVLPQPISDKSIIDSMAGIINDIVPQAYSSSSPNSDNREAITWARFEYADVNDPAFFPDYNEGSRIPPLLLVLGYTTGVQVWLIAASGEATEVLSWRQGMVRTLRILPSPRCGEREREDPFKVKRPMVAICDSAGPGPQFCSVSFISLKTGEQVKSIKFKSPVCDVLANKRSIVVTFPERIAVFDAKTLEDVLTITTCYFSPGPNPNPVALGTRWLAYGEKKLVPGRRSSGGSEGEGVSSYTATVLYAAKSLGKGLRGLGETVASSLTGNSVSPMTALNNSNSTDSSQPGVVSILDLQAAKEEKEIDDGSIETFVAHFTAHSEAIVAMTFDQTGALLMTADKRGHDFHVFRIQPHPVGPSLAAVYHLYVLHRGDTTAKVQDMTFSCDARWAAVSTVRGTTHVFPVAPYGGPVGVRTHSLPHVVNRMSRFHKSAGLTDDGARSHSPVSHAEPTLFVYPYTNPRLPPYPHPTILHPLAQIRQPSSLNHTSSQPQPRVQQRQRLHSDDSVTLPLKICACFAPPRAWIYAQRDTANKLTKRAVDSLYIMACHGNMIQYDLDPKPAAGVPKEKICDKTPIELEVEAKGQWPLLRTTSSSDIVPPLPPSSLLLGIPMTPSNDQDVNSNESRWLSQVEIFTHVGPPRRLWMGPQFVFKTYNAPSGVAANLVEAETVEVGIASGSRPARSNPVNMPHTASRPLVPVVIDGSGSSYEQSPRFVEAYGDAWDHEQVGVICSGENQLREDLAEAMLETSSTPHRVTGRRLVVERVGHPVAKVVNPLGTVITVSADEEEASSSPLTSSQDNDEFDEPTSLLGTTSSAPSICAQEGKAGLRSDCCDDEGQTLREHTEICAEMRSANEPAIIDSVPDENIEDVKERRSLCAEAASAANCSTVDLDRVGAFKDVPSSPSLCAERGAVPDCSNVVQPPPARVKSVLLSSAAAAAAAAAAEEAKNALGRELGYQLVEGSSSKADLSDDDLEHINKEELIVVTPKVTTKKPAGGSSVLSSDDDLVHVLHCDIPESEKRKNSSGSTSGNGRKRSKEKQQQQEVDLPQPTPPAPVILAPEIAKETKCFKEAKAKSPMPEAKSEPVQQSYSKKTRIRSKRSSLASTASDMVEIINMDAVVAPPPPVPPVREPSPLPSPPPLLSPSPLPSPPLLEQSVSVEDESLSLPDMVEIIDIDAMERAEKSSGCFANVPEPNCQILVAAPEFVKKKSKRNKKQAQQLPPPPPTVQQQQLLDSLEQCETACGLLDKEAADKEVEEVCQQTVNSSWSSIVRRRSVSIPKTDEIESKPLYEVESVEYDEEDANKENVDVSKNSTDEINVVFKVNLTPKKADSEGPSEEFVKEPFLLDEEFEKKSDSEQETNGVLVERSSSSDEINTGIGTSNLVVPMDTEEENREPFVSALTEKNSTSGAASMLSQVSAALPSKKASRSKKKKRR